MIRKLHIIINRFHHRAPRFLANSINGVADDVNNVPSASGILLLFMNDYLNLLVLHGNSFDTCDSFGIDHPVPNTQRIRNALNKRRFFNMPILATATVRTSFAAPGLVVIAI